MMSKKMDFGGSRDLISDLPEALICHILSFLTTKEAASTSVLASKWRYLFAFVTNLDFDDSVHLNPREVIKIPVRIDGIMEMVFQQKKNVSTSFMDFVERVLALQGNSPVQKFSLKIQDGLYPVDPIRIFRWILNVLERGLSDLKLNMDLESECLLPSKVFLSKTLVRLKLDLGFGPTIEVEDVSLPKLKTLYLVATHFEKRGVGLTKLLSGCHMLEDLVLNGISWFLWDFASVSVLTLKRLKFCWEERDESPKSVSLDTPNIVYLKFTDTIADKYLKVNFSSLVEARINLRMSEEQTRNSHEGYKMVGNATGFVVGICNVKILYLYANTFEVLTYCCAAIPVFNNLTHLTVESKPDIGWQSLPGLLKNSPNLETLVLQGLGHKATGRCGDMCLCEPFEEEMEEEEEIPPCCLSSSPVKVLKILKFGKIYDDEIEQVKLFLEMMPNLEQLIIHCCRSFDKDLVEVSNQFQMLPRVASPQCNVQLISGQLSLSSTVPSSVSMK